MAASVGTPSVPTFRFERTFPERRTAGTGGIERVEVRFDRFGTFTAKCPSGNIWSDVNRL